MVKKNEIEKSQCLTITDIALKAGVSVSTVSRVINGSNLVGKKTKNKVQKVIDELNYIPNEMARGLIKRSSKAIALIIPDISNPFFSELIHGIEDVVKKYGYSMFLCNSSYNHEKEKSYIMEMAERRVDGIILISAFLQDTTLIRRLHRTTMRIVTIQTHIDEIDCVETNAVQGMEDAIQYLIQLGHRKIAFVCLDVQSSKKRYKTYVETLERNGIPLVKEYISEYNFDIGLKENIGYALTKKLLELPDPPTAIQTMNDYLAFGAYLAIMEKGLKIPEDISVIGFDNVTMSRLINPPLTTVSQPIYAMGEVGGELLLKNILEGANTVKREVILPTELVIRGSTGKPRL